MGVVGEVKKLWCNQQIVWASNADEKKRSKHRDQMRNKSASFSVLTLANQPVHTLHTSTVSSEIWRGSKVRQVRGSIQDERENNAAEPQFWPKFVLTLEQKNNMERNQPNESMSNLPLYANKQAGLICNTNLTCAIVAFVLVQPQTHQETVQPRAQFRLFQNLSWTAF